METKKPPRGSWKTATAKMKFYIQYRQAGQTAASHANEGNRIDMTRRDLQRVRGRFSQRGGMSA